MPQLDPKLDKLLQLKNRHERAKAERQQAEGALKETLRRLRADFGCSSIEAAEAKLAAMDRQLAADEAEFLQALDAYEKQFGTSETSETSAG